MDFEFDWSTFSGQLPLFPLPNVVQFPHTVLPLHIFEKRYQTMLEHAMETEQLIGMTVLKPGWEEQYSGNPSIYPVACLGKIVKHEPMDDGRSNILLYGLSRVRVVDILSSRPFRLARVEALQESTANLDEHEQGNLRKQLLDLYGEFVIENADSGQNYPTLSDAELPLGALSDAVAAMIGLPTETQVALLEEARVGVRSKLVIQEMKTALGTEIGGEEQTQKSKTGKSKSTFPHIHLN